jgi:WD40-like Beta Propeller Repeat
VSGCATRLCALILTISAATSAQAGSGSPPAWSPDGEWLAYVIETPAEPRALATGWIFDQKAVLPSQASQPSAPVPWRSRLWVTRPSTNTSVLLDEVAGQILAPGWSPDGRALAYGRIVQSEAGKSRYEVVCYEGTSPRTLYSHAIDSADGEPALLLRSAISWSSDGRYLAVPRVLPLGLAIVRADNGSVVRSIESARNPAWSPTRGLFYIVPGNDAHRKYDDRIEYLDAVLGSPRRLAASGRISGPLLVSKDGRSVQFICGTPASETEERICLNQTGLSHVQMRSLDPPPPYKPFTVSQTRARTIISTSFAQDREGEIIFQTVTDPARPTEVAWMLNPKSSLENPTSTSVHKRFPALDTFFRPGDLSLCPTRGLLAIRVGGPGASSLPLLCNLETMQFTPLVPDDSAREAWLRLLINSVRTIVAENATPAILDGRAIERPVALPFPGEFEPGSDPATRLRRIGRFARPLLDNQARTADRLEARFLFDYLREDYPAALASLDPLDDQNPTPARRRQLLVFRGQALAGKGDLDEARDVFHFVERVERKQSRRTVEDTSLGPVVTELKSPGSGWAAFALGRIDIMARLAERESVNANGDDLDPIHRTPQQDIEPPPPIVPDMPFLPRPGRIEGPLKRTVPRL